MELDYDENGKPVLKMKKDGVEGVIAFSDEPRNPNLKQTIIEILTASYEKRVTA